MAYLRSIQGAVDMFLSLASQRCPPSDVAARTAMDLILKRKAIGAEALAAQREAVLSEKYPSLREQLNKLRTLTNQIAQTMLAGPGNEAVNAYRKRLDDWNTEREQLEAQLARMIPEMDLVQQLNAADYCAVSNALPECSALVEFVRFHAFDFITAPAKGESRWGSPRYLAFVLRAQEPLSLKMVDLGDAEAIDLMITSFRSRITSEAEGRSLSGQKADEKTHRAVIAASNELRAAVFDPIIPYLGGQNRLLIAPDGELNRLPFEVLPSDGGHLIDRYHISYLSVGRDVLRFGQSTIRRPTDSLVIADPDFGLGSQPDLNSETLPSPSSQTIPTSSNRFSFLSKLGLGKRPHATSTTPTSLNTPSTDITQSMIAKSPHSRELARTIQEVPRLPETAEEGLTIAGMLNVPCWLGQDALERPLKTVISPQILHLATHGFFIKDQQREIQFKTQPRDFTDLMLSRIATADIENPLLRSGLVLAGVNTWLKGGIPPEEAEDGVLTAFDVSALDFTDTDLVVLSACETGLGDIRVGEGVFGLRRALILAGAKTLVMSLWKVPDEQTKELMIDFYSRILKGVPRAEALRDAQLAIKKNYPHPYFWGAFICQGDPDPLALWEHS